MASNGVSGHSGSISQRQSIIVTGGASGIGLAMTRHFASEGHRIAILDVNQHTGPAVMAEVAADYPQATLSFKKCDVSSWQEQAAVFKEVFEEHGKRLDIVMANAGLSEQGSSSLVSVEEDEPVQPTLRTVNVNLIGVIYCKITSSYTYLIPLLVLTFF